MPWFEHEKPRHVGKSGIIHEGARRLTPARSSQL